MRNPAAVANTISTLGTYGGGGNLSVQIPSYTDLSNPAVVSNLQAIFQAFDVKYVFSDFEGTNTVSDTTTLVNLIKAQSYSGTSYTTRMGNGTTRVGNFGIASIPNDTTRPLGPNYVSGNSGTNPFANSTDFVSTGVNMNTEVLYPGDASFRNPANGNLIVGPNAGVLSSLFIMPLLRMTQASANSSPNIAHVPFVSRFNNWTNPALQNTATGLTAVVNGSTVPIIGYQQTTGGPNGAYGNGGQLMSRGDFQALMLHYRMRGASGYQLLDPGVVGYSVTNMQADALAGFNDTYSNGGSGLVQQILAGPNARQANMPTVVTFNAVKQLASTAGVIWSAVTNDSAPGTPALAILISNLSNVNGSVSLSTIRFNGSVILPIDANISINAGQHKIIQFTKSGGLWTVAATDSVFDESIAALSDRNGIGIPEPTSLAVIGIGALGLLSRRRQRKA